MATCTRCGGEDPTHCQTSRGECRYYVAASSWDLIQGDPPVSTGVLEAIAAQFRVVARGERELGYNEAISKIRRIIARET